MKKRAVARPLMLHIIGNGKGTRFWQDLWHPFGVLKDRFDPSLTYDSFLHLNAKVEAVLGVNGWSVPAHVIPHVREIHQQLAMVQVDRLFDDRIIWKPSKNGEFDVRSTYHAIRDRMVEVDWARLIWFKGRIPRHSFIAWMAVRNALKTRAKLFAWRVAATPNCIFCVNNYETESHLFGDCSYGGSIWQEPLPLMGFHRVGLPWAEEVKWCSDTFIGNGLVPTIQRLVFCGFIYHVWAERNRRAHGGNSLQPLQVVGLIVTEIKLKAASMDLKLKDTGFNRSFVGRWNIDGVFTSSVLIQCSWVRPDDGWVMLNTDGALSNNLAGIGAIIRDTQGEVIAAATGRVESATITVHELQAVEAGLEMAKRYMVHQVVIATDSTTVVSLLKRRDRSCPWHVIHLLRRIEALRDQFGGTRVIHVYRETNRAADYLSKLAPTVEFVEVVASSFAEDLKKIVYDDKVGTVYHRL